MDLGAGAVFGALAVVLALVLLAVYVGARMRTGKAPSHAQEHEHTGPDPAGDTDPVPRDADGMPMVAPPDDPAETSADEMQQRARRNAS